MDKPGVYSPAQVGWGSLLGGPIFAVDVLRANFLALGATEAARRTLLLGIALNVALIPIIMMLPDRFPSGLIPALYSHGAWWIASSRQMKKDAIAASTEVAGRSNGRVAVRALLFLAATAAVWLAAFFGWTVVKNLATGNS